ncbi:MAG: DNA repair protein RadA [Clostridia bacterium]|nr:DNA repair protein RadA [Clostridia bacterium]MBQ2001362.1 DNA repair protein RadA [Clostridia bacterium]MBQ2319500.1 DNA repair protein RadA [Clostridia bacterium]MBQ5901915.1 DNA repair protein RadA [Clostridia bacterium]
MAKAKSVYICSECGNESLGWYGKCPNCGEWGTLHEEIVAPVTAKEKTRHAISGGEFNANRLSEIGTDDEHRYHTGVGELDRVLGGGIVKGSLVLLGGDPGIGKSTMMLQICQHLGKTMRILYVSGEESQRQIKLRADRLGVDTENLSVMAQTDVQAVCEYVRETKPDLVIIDSIQTMSLADISSSPGSVTQVRECTNMLLRTAKGSDIPIFVIGHVNKEGSIAGPKVMEHIVDAVLYFEGDRNLSYRILRAVKNRFGSTNEIGVFEMRDKGLCEVENPSKMLLSGRPANVSGTCVACVLEGSRPILAEIQGLVTTSGFGNPRRMSTGFDYNRMSLILAVLEKRCGYFFSNLDTYLNIVGGFRLDEPATDLAVALTLVSSLKDFVIPDDVVAFGEIGLAGEVRTVPSAEMRVAEAARLGFKTCIMPYRCVKAIGENKYGIRLIGVHNIRQAVEAIT